MLGKELMEIEYSNCRLDTWTLQAKCSKQLFNRSWIKKELKSIDATEIVWLDDYFTIRMSFPYTVTLNYAERLVTRILEWSEQQIASV